MDQPPDGGVPLASRCPWCSAELPDAPGATCPTCGATLAGDAEPQIPGVTTLPPISYRSTRQPKRSRLLQWISGEPSDDVSSPPARPGSLDPPPDHVRREIRKLELEAAIVNLSAEANAIAADEALGAGAPPSPALDSLPPGEPVPVAEPTPASEDEAAPGPSAS